MTTTRYCVFCKSELELFKITYRGHGDCTHEISLKCRKCSCEFAIISGFGTPDENDIKEVYENYDELRNKL